MSHYALERLVEDKLAEARALAADRGRRVSRIASRRPLRTAFGLALIRTGRRLLGAESLRGTEAPPLASR
jgi:hypothetical protein